MTATKRHPTAPPAASTDGTSRWHAETRRDDAALAELAGEWDALYRRCSTATPFSSHAWLESWWRSYGRPGRLVLVLVRRDGRLVAAAALMRAWPGVLTLVGTGVSDVTDILIDDSCVADAARRLAQELAAQRGRVIDLRDVPAQGAAWRLLDAWPYRGWRLPGSMCLELPAMSMADLIATLPPDTAKTRRKKSRKIDQAGIQVHPIPGTEAADAVRALLRLHQQQWLGRGMNPDHAQPRFAEHLTRALPAMVDRDQAVLMEYRMGGELVAVDALVVGPRAVGAYLFGMRPDLRQHVDVSQLLLGTNLALARRFGRRTLSLLRGDESYKHRWRPRRAPNARLILAGSARLPAAAYAGAVRGRSALAGFLKPRLPWLVQLRRRVRQWSPSST